MFKFRVRTVLLLGAALGALLFAVNLQAGGSGLNVVVIVNQASSNSCELANYYREKRQIPPENVLRINWAGPNTQWTSNDFQTTLMNPLVSMLASRGLTNQIDYVVLSMDIPFQTTYNGLVNGTTSAIFYGLKTEAPPDWVNITNSYYSSEGSFTDSRPASAPGLSFLTTFITSDSLDAAKKLVDHGVAGDGTFPRQPMLLAKSSDLLRNFRFTSFDNAILNTRLAGTATIVRTNMDSPVGLSNLAGFETGMYQFTISPNTFVPGAIADSLTSYGGVIFGPNDHTTLLVLINAGASGSYGTVTEPSPVGAKFPTPQVYFYQARGFNIAECYYQSLFEPYEGIVVAEPLSAPFAQPGSGAWQGASSNAVLSGTAHLSASFTSADAQHPLQKVDLFVDGKFFQAVTNVPPLPGNTVALQLGGYAINYTVPANATIASVATNLASLINVPAATNASKSVAYVFGDRIELHSLAGTQPSAPGRPKLSGSTVTNPPPANLPLSVSTAAGTATADTTFVRASRRMFLNSPAAGSKNFSISGSTQLGSWITLTVKKTTGATVSVTATNTNVFANPVDMLQQLVSLINSNTSLQALDGVFVEDFVPGVFGSGSMLLRAGSSGLKGLATRVTFSASAFLVPDPATEVALDDNLFDVQPRNHLYVSAGVTNLNAAVTLDTTRLADGYHDLTAVAYEGTHVRTQTRIGLPIIVQNSSLTASCSSSDLAATNSVGGTYHVQVTANAGNVAAIHLLSTGGELSSVTNQSSAAFTLNAANLGVGLHPIWALVETSAGTKFRTQSLWTRFVAGP
jgi:uncharacterized protein (TIGR03790 family)